MAKFSIMLFGIDSYTKNKMQLPYKLDAKSSDAATVQAGRKKLRCSTP